MGDFLKEIRDFTDALKEVVGKVSGEEIKIAYFKFLKSRSWDILHPVYEDEVLKNPVYTMDKKGFMRFFKEYNKFANNEHNQHLGLNLVQ